MVHALTYQLSPSIRQPQVHKVPSANGAHPASLEQRQLDAALGAVGPVASALPATALPATAVPYGLWTNRMKRPWQARYDFVWQCFA